jgi:hypothetical protein
LRRQGGRAAIPAAIIAAAKVEMDLSIAPAFLVALRAEDLRRKTYAEDLRMYA